jgi:hypothetical protein
MADVSKQLMSQFSDNLNFMLDLESTGSVKEEIDTMVKPIDLRAVASKALAKRVVPLVLGLILVIGTFWSLVK